MEEADLDLVEGLRLILRKDYHFGIVVELLKVLAFCKGRKDHIDSSGLLIQGEEVVG